jgi:hypothetical protein
VHRFLPRTDRHVHAAAPSKTSAAAHYSELFIRPEAVGGLDETYTAQPPTLDPHGVPGASAVFVSQANTRALGTPFSFCPTPRLRQPR